MPCNARIEIVALEQKVEGKMERVNDGDMLYIYIATAKALMMGRRSTTFTQGERCGGDVADDDGDLLPQQAHFTSAGISVLTSRGARR